MQVPKGENQIAARYKLLDIKIGSQSITLIKNKMEKKSLYTEE